MTVELVYNYAFVDFTMTYNVMFKLNELRFKSIIDHQNIWFTIIIVMYSINVIASLENRRLSREGKLCSRPVIMNRKCLGEF